VREKGRKYKYVSMALRVPHSSVNGSEQMHNGEYVLKKSKMECMVIWKMRIHTIEL
jgi:hypothetical protein